jgi:hypothetical protein
MTLEFRNDFTRPIQITPRAIGFEVKAGCAVACFTTKEEVINAITEYLNDPKTVEEKYDNSAGGGLAPEAEDRAERPTRSLNEVLRPPRPIQETGRGITNARYEDQGDCCDEAPSR